PQGVVNAGCGPLLSYPDIYGERVSLHAPPDYLIARAPVVSEGSRFSVRKNLTSPRRAVISIPRDLCVVSAMKRHAGPILTIRNSIAPDISPNGIPSLRLCKNGYHKELQTLQYPCYRESYPSGRL